jgi:hypothetical protein
MNRLEKKASTLGRALAALLPLGLAAGLVAAPALERSPRAAAQATSWGPYQALNDGRLNGTDIAIWGPGSFNYSNGERQYYWRFRNRYTARVRVTVRIFKAEGDGSTSYEDSMSGIMAANGGVYQSGGLWTICRRITGYQLMKIEFPDSPTQPPGGGGGGTTPPGGGGGGTTPPGGGGGGTTPPPSTSGRLDLAGPVSWRASGSTITIAAAKVSNGSQTRTSGTLKLAVYATASPYAGGSISGYNMGELVLGQLSPNYSYSNISRAVAYRQPPSGTWYSTMLLLEYNGGGYSIVDYIAFPSSFQIGTQPPPPGGGTNPPPTQPPAGTSDLRFGGWRASWSGTSLSMTVNNVANYSYTRPSGTLSLELWALPRPYNGAAQSGYKMGSFSVAGLPARQQYTSLVRTVPLNRPSAGSYYGVMILREGSAIRYYNNSSAPFTVN